MTKRELMILINAHSVARIVEDVVAPIDGFGNTMPDKGIESDIMYLYQVINAHTIKSVKGKSDSEFEVWRDNLLLYSNDVSTEDVVNALYDPENTEPFTEEELEMIKNAYKGLKPLREAARKLTGSERLAPEIEYGLGMLKEFIKDESAAKKITADDLAVFINAYLVSDTLDTLAPALEGDFTNPPRVANYTISKIYSVIFAHSKHVGKDTDEMQDWIDNILCDSSMSTKEKAKVLYDEENASALTPEEEKYIKDTYNALENIRMAAKILTGSERLSLRIEAPIKALRRFINTEARIPTKFDALFNVIKPMQKKLEAGSLSKGERTVRDGGIMSLWGEILPMVRGLIAKTENTPSRKADMEQECFEAFLKNLWDYEPGIGSPRTYFKPYFARIIHINTAL